MQARVPVDRRAHQPLLVSAYWLTGRRRGGRRAGELTNVYVDRCAGFEVTLVLTLIGLAVIDWAWTLVHLRYGVEEANPILRVVLESGGVWAFSAVKLGITWVAGAFLLRHVRFRVTRWLLPPAIAVYATLLLVHAATSLATSAT